MTDTPPVCITIHHRDGTQPLVSISHHLDPTKATAPLLCGLIRPKPLDDCVYRATSIVELKAFIDAMNPHDQEASRTTMVRVPPRVLTIAGSDSGGGAGIQADIKACTHLRVYSSSAITAITAQNSHGVHGIHPIPPRDVAAQIDCVLNDIGANVVKTGMLFSKELIQAVVAAMERYKLPLVVDPVMVATSGDCLLAPDAIQMIKERLFPLATIITPNLPEASALLDGRALTDQESMLQAAEDLHALGPLYVLIKGGHLAPDANGNIIDVLYDGKQDAFHTFETKKLTTRNTHGTGCTLAAAIAACYAKNDATDMVAAVKRAREYLQTLLIQSQELQIGTGDSGPMFHRG